MKRESSKAAFEALEKLRASLQLSKRQFIISYLGIDNPQNYTNWAKRGVPLEMVLLISKYKDLDANALLEGNIVPATPSPMGGHSNVSPMAPLDYRVPVISWVCAGNFDCSTLDQCSAEEASQWVYLPRRTGSRAFGLVVSGPSMEPRFHDGDFIVVDPDAPWKDGDFVIIGDHGEEAVFKQIVRDGSDWWARPLNPQFAAKLLEPNCYRVIGRVVWHQKPPTAL